MSAFNTIVPFGKYQGQDISTLLRDKRYTKWFLRTEDMKQRYPTFYAMVSAKLASSSTPSFTQPVFPSFSPPSMLPTVPFGKHKGKCITELLQDEKYVDWLKLQPDLPIKYPVIYNIIISGRSSSSHDSTPTPEHNKLQNHFLRQENCRKLFEHLYGKWDFSSSIWNRARELERFLSLSLPEHPTTLIKKMLNLPDDYSPHHDYSYRIEFEGRNNWDVIIVPVRSSTTREYIFSSKDDFFNIAYELVPKASLWLGKAQSTKWEEFKLSFKTEGVTPIDSLYCEIKPQLGDDYPVVLRKMKQQIALTAADKHPHPENRRYVLLVGEFHSAVTTFEELCQIFDQTAIQVILVKDLNLH